MKREELSMAYREVVEVLMRFNDKMPTKGLVRVFLSMHPLVDLEGKKNLNLFKALRKEQAEKAKNVGNVDVPNLQEPLVEKPKACLIELSETIVHWDIEISLVESLVYSIDNMEPNSIIKAMLELNNKALILGRKIGALLQREIKEGGQAKVRCLDSEKNLNENIADMETDYDELKEKNDGLEMDVSDSKYDVNKDVVDGRLVNELDSSPEEEVGKVAVTDDVNPAESQFATLAQASLARLGEISRELGLFLLARLARAEARSHVLGEGGSRSGESPSPKRECEEGCWLFNSPPRRELVLWAKCVSPKREFEVSYVRGARSGEVT
ncbi:hypothetical protein DEO72_LG11g2023 [Vigna unguiculata]|uniref:Uncharacterized protein n=1 Tax=Vigna unguiculata TaxID=3917 RepID=A0A4D6NRW7_VIGUN|nr:hypothetical protein DEO72_LG11g2023 [Vigna unguiculata]